MTNFFRGLVIGLLGFLFWVVVSVGAALASIGKGEDDLFASPLLGALVIVGFSIMIGGPMLFWIVAPLVSIVRRDRKEPT